MNLHLPVAVGDEVTSESVLRVLESLHAVDPGLLLGLGEPDGSVTMHIFSNPDRNQNGIGADHAARLPDNSSLGGIVGAGAKIDHVAPR